MPRLWTPADLPADFKLFEYDWARNDLITLDANGGIVSIADTWQGRLAGTTVATNRRKLSTLVGGVQSAYRANTPSFNQKDGIILADTTGLPTGNADRFMGFCVVVTDGLIGGYRGGSNLDYFFDSFNPGARLVVGGTYYSGSPTLDKTTPHWLTAQQSGTNGLIRANGVTQTSFTVTPNTTISKFGIAGADDSYYPMQGHSLYAMVGKRAPTQDENWKIEWWVATNKTFKTLPNDNPYKASPPIVATPDTVYVGARAKAQVYLGARTDAQLYVGLKGLFP